MTVTIVLPNKTIYKDQWGNYHTCDYQTARLLRRIRGEFEKASKRAAAWNRYYRKAERNRKTLRPELVRLFTKFELVQTQRAYNAGNGELRYELVGYMKAIVPWHIMCDARLISSTRYSKSEDVPQLPVTKEQVLAFCEELGLSTSVGKVRSAK